MSSMSPVATSGIAASIAHGDKPKFMRCIFLWLQQVATDRTLPPMAASLAIVLAGFVNQHSGEAWPTQETLANALGISERAVSRNVVELAERGHLEVVISRGRHKPNVYRPVLKNQTQTSGIDPEKPDDGVMFSSPKTGRARQENRTRVAEKPDARDKKTGRQRPTQLSNELSKELSRELSNAHARESDRPNDGDDDRCGEKPRRTIDRDVGENSPREQKKPSDNSAPQGSSGENSPPAVVSGAAAAQIIGRRERKSSGGEKPRRRPMNGYQDLAEGFEEFYRSYPRHVARGAAEKAYRRIIRNGEASPAELLNGAMRYAAERTGEPERFTKHPTTWLNGQCWKDAPAATGPRSSTNVERLMEQCGLVARGSDDEEIDQ